MKRGIGYLVLCLSFCLYVLGIFVVAREVHFSLEGLWLTLTNATLLSSFIASSLGALAPAVAANYIGLKLIRENRIETLKHSEARVNTQYDPHLLVKFGPSILIASGMVISALILTSSPSQEVATSSPAEPDLLVEPVLSSVDIEDIEFPPEVRVASAVQQLAERSQGGPRPNLMIRLSIDEFTDIELSSLTQLATQENDAEAQYNLGVIYSLGIDVPQSHDVALHWFRMSAQQSFAKAQYQIGWAYLIGNGVAQDKAEALKWFRLAAEQGNAIAQFQMGAMYKEWRNYDILEVSQSEAAKWFLLSAEQGILSAQNQLGLAYEYGWGVPENATEANRLYSMAARQGYNAAQFNLAEQYRNGRGILQDKVKAYIWFSIAATTENNELARELRNQVAEDLSASELTEAQAIATRCYQSDYQNCD